MCVYVFFLPLKKKKKSTYIRCGRKAVQEASHTFSLRVWFLFFHLQLRWWWTKKTQKKEERKRKDSLCTGSCVPFFYFCFCFCFSSLLFCGKWKRDCATQMVTLNVRFHLPQRELLALMCSRVSLSLFLMQRASAWRAKHLVTRWRYKYR